MNTQAILLTGFIIAASFTAQAQQGEKGYYGIGKNSEKLKNPATEGISVQRSENHPTVQKGYYSIGKNNRKLPKPVEINSTSEKTAPKKGYYGIGNNEQKLKNQ